MAQNIQTRLQYRTGLTADATEWTQMFQDACRKVCMDLLKTRPTALRRMSKWSTGGNTLNIQDNSAIIMSVLCDNYPAKEVDIKDKQFIWDGTSTNTLDTIFRVSAISPAYYIDTFTGANTTIVAMPTTVSVTKAEFIDYDTMDALALTGTDSNRIPAEILDIIIVYTSILILENQITDLINSDEDVELASAVQGTINILTSEYYGMLSSGAPPAPPQPEKKENE
tara:strand:+ start:10676 stop:11350 length:675 start_codon:yes stop_codon:yes gene_type:complete